ncbi:MAG: AAA family ATPase [Bacilli bacterium]|nr:AAA family ATPase [Bacilli bacterium]
MDEEKVRKFLESCTVELKEFIPVYLLFVKKIDDISVYDMYGDRRICGEELALFNIIYAMRFVAGDDATIRKNIIGVNLQVDVPQAYSEFLREAKEKSKSLSRDELIQLIMTSTSNSASVLIDNINLEREDFSLKFLRNNLIAAYSGKFPKLTERLKEFVFAESNDIEKETQTMATAINYEEYKEKALPDTKYILDAYFAAAVLFAICFKNGASIYKKDENRLLDDNETILFIFLFVLYMFPNDVRGMWMSREIDVLANYDFPPAMVDIAKSFEAQMNNVSEVQKKDFYNENLHASAFMRKYLDTGKEKISIERIVANIFKKYGARYPHFIENFKLDELMEELEGLACAKEKQDRITVIYGGGDLSKALEDAGLRLSGDVKTNTGKNSDSQKGISYGKELTNQVYEHDPLFGRKKELRKLGALLLDDKKSVIIKGLPGVGKTSLMEGLAYRIQHGTIHELLKDFRIFAVSATEMLAGTSLRGQLEEKMLNLIHELMEFKNAILFIDEIHMLMGGGTSVLGSSIDLSNMLKPYVGNGKVKIVGATTDKEYGSISRDGAFERRFNTISILPLKEEEIIFLLNNLIKRYEQTKHISFPLNEDERTALFHLIFELSDQKYQSENLRYNPDLALTILDNAYDFARYDNKAELDFESFCDGLSAIESINEDGVAYFQEEGEKLLRKK